MNFNDAWFTHYICTAIPLPPIIDKVVTDSESHSVAISWHNSDIYTSRKGLITSYNVCYRETYPVKESIREVGFI